MVPLRDTIANLKSVFARRAEMHSQKARDLRSPSEVHPPEHKTHRNAPKIIKGASNVTAIRRLAPLLKRVLIVGQH